jgi:hypothetical protein
LLVRDNPGLRRSNSNHGSIRFTPRLTPTRFSQRTVSTQRESAPSHPGLRLTSTSTCKGGEPAGTVTRTEYLTLQQQLFNALQNFTDSNPNYTNGTTPVFDKIYTRPVPADINDPQFGRQTNDFIGQDSGDVFAMLRTGYNFDGAQSPVVIRKNDPVVANPVLSVSNFYGAHGYDPNISNMSAIFFAAGPDIGRGTLRHIQTVDVAPTILKLLGVAAPETVDAKLSPCGCRETCSRHCVIS